MATRVTRFSAMLNILRICRNHSTNPRIYSAHQSGVVALRINEAYTFIIRQFIPHSPKKDTINTLPNQTLQNMRFAHDIFQMRNTKTCRNSADVLRLNDVVWRNLSELTALRARRRWTDELLRVRLEHLLPQRSGWCSKVSVTLSSDIAAIAVVADDHTRNSTGTEDESI